MTCYETMSLWLTGTYDALTLGLLSFVAYETLIKPRTPDIAFYFQTSAKDTKTWSTQRPVIDFILENRGAEIENIRITSEPDDLRWGTLRELNQGGQEPLPTSEYFKNFHNSVPRLLRNDKLTLFWCDLEENGDVVSKPFSITIECDDPRWPWRKKYKRQFKFDLSSFNGLVWGLTTRYEIHHVAQELARMRTSLEQLNSTVTDYARRELE